MATVQERQRLAAQLRQVAQDNAFVYQAGVLEKQLGALPGVPPFTEEQVEVQYASGVLRTAQDCVDLVTVAEGQDGPLAYGEWQDLVDRYFHDERLPLTPLPQAEDAFVLVDELVKRDGVAKTLARGRRDEARLGTEIPERTTRNKDRLSSHREQVAGELEGVQRQLARAQAELQDLRRRANSVGQRSNNPLIKFLMVGNGCMPYLIAFLVTGVVNSMTGRLLPALLIGIATFLAIVVIPTAFTSGIGTFGPKDERRMDELDSYVDQATAHIKSLQSTPTWYEEEARTIAWMRGQLTNAQETVHALQRYEWPLDAAERLTLAQVTRDISADAQAWRSLMVDTVEAAVAAARRRMASTSDEIGLMPNAVPDALELAAIVENGYADDVKEAMLYMATDRYRTSNLGLQAAQLNQMELARMEGAQYVRDLMAQLLEMSGQLNAINQGIGGVASRLDEANATLRDMDRTLDSIDSGVWATAGAAQATAANTAATAANTARIASDTSRIAQNTAAGAYHASRAADAAKDLRDFYAEDHPSHNADGDNKRL